MAGHYEEQRVQQSVDNHKYGMTLSLSDDELDPVLSNMKPDKSSKYKFIKPVPNGAIISLFNEHKFTVTFDQVDQIINQALSNQLTKPHEVNSFYQNGIKEVLTIECLRDGSLMAMGYKPSTEQALYAVALIRKGMITYFIECSVTGLIKIGQTKSIVKRIKSLQTGSPTILWLKHAVIYDGYLETKLHQKFKSSRVHGEWFLPNKGLSEFIDNAIEDGFNSLMKNTY